MLMRVLAPAIFSLVQWSVGQQVSVFAKFDEDLCAERGYRAAVIIKSNGPGSLLVLTNPVEWSMAHLLVSPHPCPSNVPFLWNDRRRTDMEAEYAQWSDEHHPISTDEYYVFDAAMHGELIDGMRRGGTNSVAMCFYGGKGAWYTSDVSVVRYYREPDSQSVIGTNRYMYPPGSSAPSYTNEFTLGRVAFGGNTYLYMLDIWQRICRIPSNGTLDVHMDEESNVLSVDFPGTPEPTVRFLVSRLEVLSGSANTTPLWYWVQQKKQELGIP